MHTPNPAAGTTPLRRRRPRRRWFTRPRMIYMAPVAAAAGYGAWWIAAHAGGGRASAHTFWQSLALAETLLTLLLRDRKPATAVGAYLHARREAAGGFCITSNGPGQIRQTQSAR